MADEQPTETTETPESASLLDMGGDQAATPTTEAAPADDPGFPTKFADPEGKLDSAKLLESYKHLESKIGSFQGAPDVYEYNVPDGIVLDDAKNVTQDPRVAALATVAKELNMGQDGFDKLLSAALEAESVHQAGLNQQADADRQREIAKLGPNAAERMGLVGNFLANNFDEAGFEFARHTIAQTAEGAVFLEQVMQLVNGSTKIPTNVTGAAPMSSDDVFATMDMDRYIKDPQYRSAMQAKAGMR